MATCVDYTPALACDWHAEAALAYVREKKIPEALRSLASSDQLLDIEDANQRLRNNGVYARIRLTEGLPYAKVLFWQVAEGFKESDRKGVSVNPVYFRNTLWFAMVAAARWQRKELTGQDKANVFAELYDEVMNGVKLHDGTIVVENRSGRRAAARALKWLTAVGRPFVAWFICHQ